MASKFILMCNVQMKRINNLSIFNGHDHIIGYCQPCGIQCFYLPDEFITRIPAMDAHAYLTRTFSIVLG